MEDELWDATGFFGYFAEAYGWTQRQTLRENEQWFLDRLPGFRAVVDEIRADKQREDDQAAQRKADMNKGW